MRKFFRAPALILLTSMMPLLTLVIMGDSFGGKSAGTRVALVDNDHGPRAVKIREACDSIAVSIGTFCTVTYHEEKQAYEDVQNGRMDAAIFIPARNSRNVFAQDAPRLGLIVNNSDQFTTGLLEGVSVTLIGSWLARLPVLIRPLSILELLCMIVPAAIAFIGMMFLFMVRVDKPLVPRALSGFLNLLLFHRAGSIYPIAAFPFWLRAIAIVNPFTYCIHGFRSLLTKSDGIIAIRSDRVFLLVFGLGTLTISIPLFKRTLLSSRKIRKPGFED